MAQEAQNGGGENGAAKVDATPTFIAGRPQLFIEAPKANDAVQFYKTAFGAEEVSRTMHPKRKADQELPLVLAADLKLGSFSITVSDITDDSPVKIGTTGSVICLETDNVEAALKKAIAAGAHVLGAEGDISEGEGACCGGSTGKVKDPFGNIWLICSASSPKKFADVEAAA